MYKDFAQFVFFIKLILFFNFCDIMLYYNNSHGQNEVNQVKKKTLVPLIIFLLGICLVIQNRHPRKRAETHNSTIKRNHLWRTNKE